MELATRFGRYGYRRITALLRLAGWVVSNARLHGTTYRIPWEMLDEERAYLGKLPDRATLAPYLREDRKVARDGFIGWEGSRYGVHWKWVGSRVQVGQRLGTEEIWSGNERIAVHPRAQLAGQRFILPGQWQGLPRGMASPSGSAVAVQIPAGEVERRSLDVYELAALEVWPESHWPGFALREADVFKTYMAWWCM